MSHVMPLYFKSHCRWCALLIVGALMMSILASCSSADYVDRGTDNSGRESLSDISGESSGSGTSFADTEDHYEDTIYEGKVLETSPDARVLYVGECHGQIFVADQRTSTESDSVGYWLSLFDASGEKISEQMLDYSCESSSSPHISQTTSGMILFETEEVTLDPASNKSQFHIWLQKFALTGEKIASSSEIQLSGVGGIEDVLVDMDDNYYIVNTSRVYVFDSSFHQTATVKAAGGSYNLRGVCVDNTIYIIVSNGKNQTLRQLGTDHVSFTDAIVRLDQRNVGYSFIVSDGNLYAMDGIALYRFNWSVGQMEPFALLVNLVEPGATSEGEGADEISYYPLTSLGIIQIRKFNSRDEVCLFRETVKDNENEKTIITIGGQTNGEDDLKPFIQAFNATSSEYCFQYQISDTDDSSHNSTIDIITGQSPDIYVNPPEDYLSEEYFLDLNTYLSSDPDVKASAFPASLLSAMETKGKLFFVSPDFSICGLEGPISRIGDRTKWTTDEFFDAANDLPKGLNFFFCGSNQNYLLADFSNFMIADFVTGSDKISFNNNEFYKLMDFCKEYGNEGNASRTADYSPEGSATMIMNIPSLSNYNELVHFYGEPISVTGFPSESPKNALAVFSHKYAISINSAHADVCWSMLRNLFLSDYQKEITYDSVIPSTLVGIEYAIQAALSPSDEDKERFVEQSIFQNPISKTTTERFLQLIRGLDGRYIVNQGISEIIIEESPPYFLGQKSSQDVADIITNRSQILIDEKGIPIISN